MVTVTADRHVNKGPGRPIFSDRLRAETGVKIAAVSADAELDEFLAAHRDAINLPSPG